MNYFRQRIDYAWDGTEYTECVGSDHERTVGAVLQSIDWQLSHQRRHIEDVRYSARRMSWWLLSCWAMLVATFVLILVVG